MITLPGGDCAASIDTAISPRAPALRMSDNAIATRRFMTLSDDLVAQLQPRKP